MATLLLADTDWFGTAVPLTSGAALLVAFFVQLLRQFSRTDQRVDDAQEARIHDKDGQILRLEAELDRAYAERDRLAAELRESKAWSRALEQAMQKPPPRQRPKTDGRSGSTRGSESGDATEPSAP